MILNTQTLQVGLDGMGWDGMDGSLGLVEYRAPYGANNIIADKYPRPRDVWQIRHCPDG